MSDHAEMSDAIPSTIDTRDMIWIHNLFRRAFADAGDQIATVEEGDIERANAVTSYLGEVLWLLHAHHGAEDVLLYPLLAERAPEFSDLYSRMETQHEAVASRIDSAKKATVVFGSSASPADGEALTAACRLLREEVEVHLEEEETEILPIASRTITAAEWGALPEHAFSEYAGTRPWLLIGLILEVLPESARDDVLAHFPPPVSEMWSGFGADAFRQEMASIRGVAA
jgi:hemerythrin-like domain-containing protein